MPEDAQDCNDLDAIALLHRGIVIAFTPRQIIVSHLL